MRRKGERERGREGGGEEERGREGDREREGERERGGSRPGEERGFERLGMKIETFSSETAYKLFFHAYTFKAPPYRHSASISTMMACYRLHRILLLYSIDPWFLPIQICYTNSYSI